MLEQFQQRIGAETGVGKQILGKALGVARDLADATRESDCLRLVGDIVTARQSEDTFKTFREAGRTLGIEELARLGEVGERHHDEYVHEANRLVQQMFVDHARRSEEHTSELQSPQYPVCRLFFEKIRVPPRSTLFPYTTLFRSLVGDIVTARQSEDTFKTFREAGRTLGIEELARLGEVGERHHDEYVHEANRLVQQMFVDHARGAELVIQPQAGAQASAQPNV